MHRIDTEITHIMSTCSKSVTRTLSLTPLRQEISACRNKATTEGLCTRHWNDLQRPAIEQAKHEAEKLLWQQRHDANNIARQARGALPAAESSQYYDEGAPCTCGHLRGDHRYTMCNHMFVGAIHCEHDECDHCGCRDYQ
jgi:hypothetical protein